MRRLTPEAREGLMRAWISILSERHPGVTWIPADGPPSQQPLPNVVEVDFRSRGRTGGVSPQSMPRAA
jgi:hypothetical protein